MAVEVQSAAQLVALSAGRRPSRWRKALGSRNLVLGLGILLLIALVGLLAPFIMSSDPYTQHYDAALLPPGLAHPFGTDEFGRDLLTRVIYGVRVDLKVGIISVIAPFVIGIILGSLAGYFGGFVDTIVMRLLDIVQAFPFIVLIIAIVAILGPGLTNMYFAVAAVGWIVYARLIRGEFLVQKNQEYVVAGRAIGLTDRRLILRHLLPNTISTAVIYAMADIALYIGLAAALSFLGLGAKPPTPEWGAMITEGQSYITSAWWMSALPGLAIIVTGIALSLVGDGLSDLIRPGAR